MQTQLIFSREDSLANPLALRENEKARMMNATCGTKCLEQFKKLNPNTSSLKMSLVSQILMGDWYSSRCALTWKLKGTKYNRLLFALHPKTLRTEGIEFGLLPTITASFGERGGNLNPQSNHDTEKAMRIAIPKLMGMLPTPSTTDWNTPYTEAQKNKKINRRKEEGKLAYPSSLNQLRQLAYDKMLPTPTCQDARQKENSPTQMHKTNELSILVAGGSGSQLSPRFVAEMMGFPPNWTELPFLNGGQKV
jgi:hypothetical protein